ncbi:MAG: sensor histidine kinase [Deltaproteobacteria bacterium]|nr:sensor histidine kinase [Deltaproteobacteria bacterium]
MQCLNLSLEHAETALTWLNDVYSNDGTGFEQVQACDIFVLVGLAALARNEALQVDVSEQNTLGRFAHAVGFDEVISTAKPFAPTEKGRTVSLARFTKHDQYEQAVTSIVKLIFPVMGNEEAQQTLRYVLIELFRNVNQHSRDPLGGVVAAQVQEDGSVQVAIADCGVGIPQALAGMHPSLGEPAAALNRAICAHISGSFAEGETGGGQNAGMGLFFISEMTKLVAGTLLVASRGDALLLRSNPEELHDNHLRTLGLGYPGTLVAFSLFPENVGDFDGILEKVNENARRYTPKSSGRTHWLSFEGDDFQSSDALQLMIAVASEDTVAAAEFATNTLEKQLLQRQALQLNFRNLKVCTQSFLHALLYEPVRLAWALKVPVQILNATPAVKGGLRLLENYALAV